MELPIGAQLYHVFHVSLLRKNIGNRDVSFLAFLDHLVHEKRALMGPWGHLRGKDIMEGNREGMKPAGVGDGGKKKIIEPRSKKISNNINRSLN